MDKKAGTFGVIQEDYFEWLCEKVEVGIDSGRNEYTNLLRILYSVPFFWTFSMDENRMKDGKALRDTYGMFIKDRKNVYKMILEAEINDWKDAIGGPCTFLEFIIALCERIDRDLATQLLENQRDRTAEWFWLLMQNIDFLRYSDDVWEPKNAQKVTEKLNFIMTRQYDDDGTGGLFPLKPSNKPSKTVQSEGENRPIGGQNRPIEGQNRPIKRAKPSNKMPKPSNNLSQFFENVDGLSQKNWENGQKNQDIWHQANNFFRVHPELLELE